MAVRICTIDVRTFSHHGLVVGEGWTAVDKDMPELARAALRDHYGRFVRVHPEDVSNLAELGLTLKDGKLLDVKPTTPTTTASKTASKGDGKKD